MKTPEMKIKWQHILGVVFVVLALFAKYNTAMYSETIGKVVKVSRISSSESESGGSKSYTEELKIKVLNGKYKGRTLTVSNDYLYSRVTNDKYIRGGELFLSLEETSSHGGSMGEISATIIGTRRDYYCIWLLLVFVYMVIVLSKKRGIRSLISVLVNVGILILALELYDKGMNYITLSIIMMVSFSILTLLISNKIRRTSFIAIISTLMVMGISQALFYIVMRYGKEIDYAALDYIVGTIDPEEIFFISISIAGIGAVMDVAISIASSLSEVIKRNPKVSFKELFASGREIGYDIMGTMTSVLFFTYSAGLIPIIIIKMKNDIPLLTILRLQVPFEICRFLIGGIGILLAIPVSILVTAFLLKGRSLLKKEVA